MISQIILSIALLISCSLVTLAELGIDKPVLSTINRYSPVYQHDSRPVPFLFASNFTLTSESGLFTSLVVCVFTITNLETLYVDSSHPLIQSPVTINMIDSICRQLNFNPSIDNTTLLGLFSAFRYSENTETLSNLNNRIMSVSVHSENDTGDPLLFNITYPAISNSPISIQASPVVYYERIASSIISGNILSTIMSNFTYVQRQFVLDNNPITSLIINSSTIHIPTFSIWNNFMCTSNSFTHPVNKFQYCSEQEFFNDLDLNSFFILKFNLMVYEVTVENEVLKIYRADDEQSYGFVNIAQSTTQNPDANHFSIWFKNKPGNSLVGCPLEVHNGDFVDYEICLTGSESVINFIYTGLAPHHHHVTVSYPTEGEFRVNDWNFVSVSVRIDSIFFLLNGKLLVPSEFSWRDSQGNINTTEIPVHLYSSSSNSVTSVYILGRVSGFIGEVTGVIVDQFYISPVEAHCMFSCVEGFYLNETILNDLVQSGLEIDFGRESIEVTGTISLTQVNSILENLYHYTPTLSSNTYRLVTVNASDANSVAISTTRISHECSSNLCFNNSYCFVSNVTDTCSCLPGFFDISDNGNNSVCKHPMDCSYLNGGCSSLETCIQFGENIRECVDACRYSPCLNNGVCTPLTLTEYNCICDTGFYGADCECRNNCLTQGCSVGECVPFCNGTFRCIAIPTVSTITTMLFSTAGSTMISSLATAFQVPISSKTSTAFMFSTYLTELPAQTQITSDLSPSVAFTSAATTSVHIPSTSEPSVLFSSAVTSSLLMPVSPEIPFVPISSTSFIAPSSSVSASPVITSVIQTPVTSEVPTSSVTVIPIATSVQISSASLKAATPAITSPIPGVSEVSTSVGITQLVSTTLTSSSLSAASVDESFVSQTRLDSPSTSSLLSTFPSSLSAVSSSSQLLISTQLALTSSLPAVETTPVTSSLLFPSVSPSPQSQTTSTPTTASISSSITSSPNLLQTQTTTNILSPSVASVISSPPLTSSLSSLDETSSVPPPLSSSISILPSSSLIQSQPTSTSRIVPTLTTTIIDIPISSTETSIPISTTDMTSSFVMTSSSTVGIVISSTPDPLSSSDVLTSSTPLTSSLTSTPPLAPLTTSQMEQVTTSQVEQVATSQMEQVATSQMEQVTTSQVEQATTSQVEQATTSQMEQATTSQVEQATTSQMEQATTSQMEQATTSQVEQVTTSSIPMVIMSSSVLDETMSSTEPIQSTATALFRTESSVSSAVPSSSISDLLLPSPATSTFSTPSQSSPVTTVVTPTSPTTMPPSLPPITPGPTIGVTGSSGSIGIGIGVAFGILLVIVVVIVAIAIIVALFYFRRSFVREHDPMKDFDDSEPMSPAKITAVYKNEGRSLI